MACRGSGVRVSLAPLNETKPGLKPGFVLHPYAGFGSTARAQSREPHSDLAQSPHWSRATKASQRQHALKSLNHSAFHASHGDLNPGENF